MRSHRFACIALSAVLLLGACKSPGKKLSDETDKISSWASSLQMLCETWLRGGTPTVFAKAMSKAAEDELKKELEAIGKLKVSDSEKSDLAKATTQLRGLAASMHDQFDSESKNDIAESLATINQLGKKLDEMKKASDGS
jgi:hypothetical protein